MNMAKRNFATLLIFSLLISFNLPFDPFVTHAAESSPDTIHGLKAEYYTSSGPNEFRFDTLKATVIDPQINFGAFDETFMSLVGKKENVNVRWTGQITANFSEDYTFWMIGDNGFRLWIDNKLIIDHWVNDWDKEQKGSPISLTAGKKYDFKIEYFQNTGGSNLFLRWSSPSVAKQIVPIEAFTLPVDFAYNGPVTGTVFPDGLNAEFTFLNELNAPGDNVLEQLSVNVMGKDWPIASAALKAGDAKTVAIEFMHPLYSKDAPTANVAYNGGGSLTYADGSSIEEFYLPIKNNSKYQIETPWAGDVDPNNPLPEYPRPQMVREDWMNLNGQWEFQAAKNGDALPTGQTLKESIIVPFAAESKLSGIERQEKLMWYKRSFTLPKEWDGQRVKLNFGAVDYLATVYVNGTQVGSHKGGFTSFSFDITDQLKPGENELIVHVLDQTDSAGEQIKGKQTSNPGGIWYTSVSGIWQTVWLEPVSEASIDRLEMVPDIWNGYLKLTADVVNGEGKTIEAVALKDGVEVGRISGDANTELQVPVPDARWWTPDDPFLYDLHVTLKEGDKIHDELDSYFGMREIKLGKVDGIQRPLLNGEFVFQMGPLDQGYWPDGIYTAPTDEALKFDIEAVKRLDMNMIRKHIKIEPARWYYWADKLGVMVWQDMPSGVSNSETAKAQYFKEYDEMVSQLQTFPSIVVYVVFNEGWGQFDEGGPETRRAIAHAIEADPTRLINGATGWHDAGGGIYEDKAGHFFDWHRYPAPDSPTPSEYRAATLGEYGGLGLHVLGHEYSPLVFSYQLMKDKEEITDKYIQFINTIKKLKENPGLSAAVYTQITDVEYEINGLLTYDRKVEKVDFERVAAAHRDLLGNGNKADLLNGIKDAEQILDDADKGEGPSQYPKWAVDKFSAAIAKAQAVHDSGSSTKAEVVQAIAELKKAIAAFRDDVNNPLPFEDNFDDGNAEGWTTYAGVWQVEGGAYTVSKGEGFKAMADGTNFRNFTYEVDVTLNDAVDRANAGAMFRVSNPTVGNDNYQGYYAGISARGEVELGRADYNWTTLATKSYPISLNKVYKLKIVADGPNIDVYVDGNLLISAKDSVFTEGAIGLRTYRAQATFDNVSAVAKEKAVQPSDSITLDGAGVVEEGSTFTVKLGASNVSDSIYASDITFHYDSDKFELLEIKAAEPGIQVVKYTDDGNGKVRMILANIGGEQPSGSELSLVHLLFKAKGSPDSTGKISIIKAVIANGEGQETEAASAELEVKIKKTGLEGDLNGDGKISIGDMAIVASHYGKNDKSPDWNVAKIADLNGDNQVDINDLVYIARLLLNS